MELIKNNLDRYEIKDLPDDYKKQGIAAYSKIWGAIAACFGFAVKCKNLEGKTCYLIKSSALKYLGRHEKNLDADSKATDIRTALQSLAVKSVSRTEEQNPPPSPKPVDKPAEPVETPPKPVKKEIKPLVEQVSEFKEDGSKLINFFDTLSDEDFTSLFNDEATLKENLDQFAALFDLCAKVHSEKCVAISHRLLSLCPNVTEDMILQLKDRVPLQIYYSAALVLKKLEENLPMQTVMPELFVKHLIHLSDENNGLFGELLAANCKEGQFARCLEGFLNIPSSEAIRPTETAFLGYIIQRGSLKMRYEVFPKFFNEINRREHTLGSILPFIDKKFTLSEILVNLPMDSEKSTKF